MNDSALFLATDSGGSKTIWTLINSFGKEIFEYRTEGLGAIREGILPVRETVLKAAQAMKDFSPVRIHLSLGGPNTNEVSKALKEAWGDVPIKVEREACGDSILYAAEFLGCSSVVMCGTGSTAVGNTKNGRCYAGGWGPIYGDGGSGGGLGSDALKLFLKSVDGMADAGRVAKLFSHLTCGLQIDKFEDRMELKKRALDMSRRELAALASSIYDLCLEGDSAAQMLYSQAAGQVADMAYSVSDNDENTKVLLCGGFFAEKPEFLQACCEEFNKKSKAKLYYDKDFSPIVGVQLSVLKDHSVNITRDICKQVFSNRKSFN